MVLTHGFLESKWCMFETHLAQSRMILQTDGPFKNQNNLILVLKDKDIVVAKLDRNVKYILKTWTYIEWPAKEENRKLFGKRLKASCVSMDDDNIKISSVGGGEKHYRRTLSD